MTDVNKRIDEFVEIANKASPGPWRVQDFNNFLEESEGKVFE